MHMAMSKCRKMVVALQVWVFVLNGRRALSLAFLKNGRRALTSDILKNLRFFGKNMAGLLKYIHRIFSSGPSSSST